MSTAPQDPPLTSESQPSSYQPSEPSSFQPPLAEPPATTEDRARANRTRTGAVWIGVWAGVVVLILLIIFIAQNTAAVEISFFALEGQIPLALAMLIAGVAGAIIAMAVAGLRILQLRRQIRRGH
jgi:uncharacterized integral membrane protein